MHWRLQFLWQMRIIIRILREIKHFIEIAQLSRTIARWGGRTEVFTLGGIVVRVGRRLVELMVTTG
jgi:hypothetical protein